MGGGEYRTVEGEGSLGRDRWNRASSKPADQESSQESSQEEAGKASPSQETEDLACLTAVVPRPQQQPPPWQPAKSKPIDIPKKRTTPPPVFEVAQDKRMLSLSSDVSSTTPTAQMKNIKVPLDHRGRINVGLGQQK